LREENSSFFPKVPAISARASPYTRGRDRVQQMEKIKKPPQEKIVLKQVLQVSVVVKDLQESMERYWDLFGIGPWEVFTFQPPDLTNPNIRGNAEPYTMKLALAQIGNVAFELIQPLTGPSIYQEFLDQKGEGFHHVAVAPAYDYDSAVDAFGKRGINILMSGTWAGTTYAYMRYWRSIRCGRPGWSDRPRRRSFPLPRRKSRNRKR
jgi:methylmalonyl-CoA/ethylmalonyl-CoA epimerase